MRRHRCNFVWALALAAASAVGCGGPRLPTAPLLFRAPAAQSPWGDIPQRSRTPAMEVLFATDRNPESVDGQPRYGSKRSASLAFGSATVELDPDLTWDQLEQASVNPHTDHPRAIRLGKVHELGRFPASGDPPDLFQGRIAETPATLQQERDAIAALHHQLRLRLADAPRKEVVIYIHGYANRFEDSAFRAAQLWHYLGRQFVPIVYSWPAGSDLGLLRGYARDRESGEFTAFHLRRFLVALAQCPDLHRIHIVAHSRGTDVLMTTLRELKLSLGDDPLLARQRLRLGTVVLAAPDLDWEVTQQRISADRVTFLPERLTCYVSPNDKAIAISDWLFASVRRIGQLGTRDLSDAQRQTLETHHHIEVVRVTRGTDFVGHSYFIDDPAVLSDLILLIRDGKLPGVPGGRPLRRAQGGFWELGDDYLNPTPSPLPPPQPALTQPAPALPSANAQPRP